MVYSTTGVLSRRRTNMGDAQAAASAAICAAREESNRGFAAHDVGPIALHWLPGMLVTQATLGEHTVSAAANAAMLTEMFATRDHVLYCRTPVRVHASPQLGVAAEEGRWVAAGWTPTAPGRARAGSTLHSGGCSWTQHAGC